MEGVKEIKTAEPEYKEMYFELFNKITDTVEALKEVQEDVEKKYLDSIA